MMETLFSEEQIMKAHDKTVYNKGLSQGLSQGLKILINTIKPMMDNDFEKIANAVRSNEEYKNVTDEEIKECL